MRLLLTGATGFIGNRLLNYLDRPENNIRLLSRKKDHTFLTYLCDFSKDSIPKKALDSVDSIFHLAGYAHDLRDASRSESLYQSINVNATIQLAKLAVKNNVKQFIFVSSVKAGGTPAAGQCMCEDDQGMPEGIYGKTKREAELELLRIGHESSMSVSIIRPSLVYGPNVKGNLQMMLSGIQKGWFPPLPKLNNRRSMIHVDDLARAILLISQKPYADGEIYIATDGINYSSREIYTTLCQTLGKPVPKWQVSKVFFDLISLLHPNLRYKINKLLGDECYSSKKLQSLGFTPKKSFSDIYNTDY